MIRKNRLTNFKRPAFRIFLIALLFSTCSLPGWARGRAGNASQPAFLQSQQDELVKNEILKYLKDHPERRSGEGLLYLSRHFKEMKEPDKALEYIQDIVRSDPVPLNLKCDALLLMVEILTDDKEYERALKELDRILSWNPLREYIVKTKIERAKLLGRGLTKFDDLFKAYKRYFWPFPEMNEIEEIQYLIGFERGYDLEVGMKAFETWEEISRFPEKDASELAYLNMAIFYAYDLSKPDRAQKYLLSIKKPYKTEAALNALFIRGALAQFHQPDGDPVEALSCYREYLDTTKDLLGYRVTTVALGNLLSERLQDPGAGINVFSGLASTPPHLTATPSISLQKREEVADEEKAWGVLGFKMAGYTAEFKLDDPDRARFCYQRALEIHKSRRGAEAESWLNKALERTEPKITAAQNLFEKAYEKYRGRDLKSALTLYETFIASYPDHPNCNEAMFRTAIITDDDLKDYEKALEMYHRYINKVVPKKSTWKLDTLYDWGRTDEVRYRIGNLLLLHRKNPLDAKNAFEQLAAAFPDSYWAMQGMKDTIKIYRENLGDENSAIVQQEEFVKKYPDAKESQDFRKELFGRYLSQNENGKAVQMIRDFLNHASPSDEGYLDWKRRWRDLAYQSHEEEIRGKIKIAGFGDKIELYSELIGILGLASTSVPLENFVQEMARDEMPDSLRWSLTYRIGAELFREYPGKAKTVFSKLAESASDTAKLACLLTLGNIAYRIDKSIPESIAHYEAAASLSMPLDPNLETPLYRLGRLYMCSGEGIKAIDVLNRFVRSYPRSRHLAKAYLVIGEAYQALHHPVQAKRFLQRVLRLSPALADRARKDLESLDTEPGPDEWLSQKAQDRLEKQEREKNEKAEKDDGGPLSPPGGKYMGKIAAASRAIKGKTSVVGMITEKDLEEADSETLYEKYLVDMAVPKPDSELAVKVLTTIIKKNPSLKTLRKAVRHYLSWRLFRSAKYEIFVEEAQQLLTSANYPESFSEILFRLAQVKERYLKLYEAANKSYFEYLSFFPSGKRVMEIRDRIPQVYERAADKKNALRFYSKLIDDPEVSAISRVEASIKKAIMEDKDQQKDEAVKTLEAALAFDSPKRAEIYLRLERLTDNFEYVQKAIESLGEEKTRLQALKRLIKKAEEDKDFPKASSILSEYGKSFTEPDSIVWIEKKTDDLGKRGVIAEIEDKIEKFPEESETPSRLFRLAKMVEGTENTKYRAQDLFYEITLVYPRSEFFRESKIRAENTRSINSIQELETMLKKGIKSNEGEEILLERARLYSEALQDPTKALEDYQALLKLFPDSPRRDEAYLGLGDIALSKDRDAEKALMLWEAGLSACRDPRNREDLTKRINTLKTYREKVLYSEKREDHDEGEKLIFRVWRLDGDADYALSLIQESLAKIENRPQTARLNYLAGRIKEELGRANEALTHYEKALRCLYHPECRKDMLLYRMARVTAKIGKKEEAYTLYSSLVNRYPGSLLSRSGYYWLYKADLEAGRLITAHNRINNLLSFRSLVPSQKKALLEMEKNLTAQMNIKEMERLRGYAKEGRSEFPYYIGKVLEHDLRDYDRAIVEYEEYLKTNPPITRSRDLLLKIAGLYEQKGDYVKAIVCLDSLLKTFTPSKQDLDLVLRIGNLVEDRLANPELANIFYESIELDYAKIPEVRIFAHSKIKRIAEKRMAKVEKPTAKRGAKREYSDEDKDILDQLDEIKKRDIDDLQDFVKAERALNELWDANTGSPATLDIMKQLVVLAEDSLLDPQKAGEYYERWLSENPDDSEVGDVTMKLYDLYMDKIKDGQKALRLLEAFIKEHPTSPLAADAELKLGKANEMLVLNYDEARRIYQRIIDTKRNEPIVHEAYFRMGFVLREGFADYTNAVKIWEELNNLFYNNSFAAEALFATGLTYEGYLRNYTKARESYEKILNQYPNSPLQNQVREAILRIGGKGG